MIGVGEDDPRAVLAYGRSEAERFGTGIRLVHAYTVPPSATGTIYGLDVPTAYHDGAHEVLAEAVRLLTHDGMTSRVDPVLTRGSAPVVLESESRRARVLVIGSDDSRPWLLRLAEGSVARRLVERAECPVVVVPEAWSTTRPVTPVVAMVDRLDTAHAPLTYAFEAAAARRAELQVLHVIEPGTTRSDIEWQTARRVIDSWFDRHPFVHGSCHLVEGELHRVAAEAAHATSLLVLGRPRDRHVPHLLVQSLAQEIIAASECPVAVPPPEYRA